MKILFQKKALRYLVVMFGILLTGCTLVPAEAQEIAVDIPVVENPGQLVQYDHTLLSNADTGEVVLFFSAKWCTSCQVLEGNLDTNKDRIPESLMILKIDYDSELELRKKYGVNLQHTLVQVDSNGNMLNKWTGGNTLATILNKLK